MSASVFVKSVGLSTRKAVAQRGRQSHDFIHIEVPNENGPTPVFVESKSIPPVLSIWATGDQHQNRVLSQALHRGEEGLTGRCVSPLKILDNSGNRTSILKPRP